MDVHFGESRENTRKGMIQEKEERRSMALGTEGLRKI